MTIISNGSINTTPSTLQDAVYDPGTGALLVVESTTPSWRKYNLTTFVELGSASTLSSPGSITLINNASSVIFSTSVTTMDYVENATNYRVNFAGAATLTSTNSRAGQKSAGDVTSGVAYAVNSTAVTLTRCTSGFAVTKPTVNAVANWVSHCIILKTPGRWLVGGTKGKIYEIDSNTNVVDMLDVTVNPNSGLLQTSGGAALAQPVVTGLSYDNNMLLVITETLTLCYDYSTKTKLWDLPTCGNATTDNLVICASASGETLYSNAFNTSTENNIVQEVSFTPGTEILVRSDPGGTLFTDSTNKIVSLGFAAPSGLGFALQQTTERIRIFSVTPLINTTVRTITVNPNGVDQQFRLWWINDTARPTYICLDTLAQSPATYRQPTGQTIIEVVKVGEGTNASWGESRYNT